MANIIFTNNCNIQCPFCFAKENNSNNSQNGDFDIFNSWQISSFISNKTFRFCGGEPSLNSNIIQVIQSLLAQNSDIFIMTNGIWPKGFSEYISNIDNKYITSFGYLFNILPPKLYKNDEINIIKNSLGMCNKMKTTLGFTIFSENFEFEYLINLAKEFDINKIRWSVAAPNISSKGTTIEDSYKNISKRLYTMYDYCIKNNIQIHGDCNYIQPCYWDNDELSDLMIRTKGSLNFSCSQGSPVDIDAQGNAWRCYGLYKILRTKINHFSSELELERYFTRRVNILDNIIPYDKCNTCKYWHNGCDGGCYVFRLKKLLHNNPKLVIFPVDDDDEILNCIPYRNNNYKLISDINGDKILSVNKLIIGEDENMLSFLKNIDGKKTVSDLINLWKENFSSYDSARKTIISQCRELFEKDLIKLNYPYPKIEVEKN